MDAKLALAHQALGREMSSDMIRATCMLAADRYVAGADDITCHADLEYGPHERHRLDLYVPKAPLAGAPTLVFVHGGGFVGGGKAMGKLPFYANIPRWAARQGWLGAAINYRLAPDNQWPAGAEDIARMLDWLGRHVSGHGGDPSQIFLFGQSAGAVHVADYVARTELHGPEHQRLAGAILASCIYDIGTAEPNKLQSAYFGDDTELWSGRTAMPGLLTTSVPLLLAIAEFDIPDFEAQAMHFAAAWHDLHDTYPPLLRLTGHNHLSTVLHIGSQDDNFGPEIALFVERSISAG